MNKETIELGMVVHTCNLSIQEAEAGGSWVQGQPGLHNEPLSQKTTTTKDASIITAL
jgi:hypothetical protein